MKRNAKKRKKRVKAERENEDITYRYVDGEKTEFLSLRCVICVGFIAWKEDGKPKGKELVRLYCRYISMRGYLGGANEAMGKLSSMETAEGVEWIKSTFDKYVTDQMDLVRHMGFVLAT